MLDGRPLLDVHLHAARLPTLKPSWTQWAHDFGDREVLDLEAAVGWARTLGYQRVATVGFSMGGAVAVRHAALYPDVAAIRMTYRPGGSSVVSIANTTGFGGA